MHSPTILMLESDVHIAEELSACLFNLGYPMLPVATNEAAAEPVISARYPELILLDLHFGGWRHGLQLAARIRITYELPIVFIIPERYPEAIKDDDLAQAYGFIIAPFDNTSIHATLLMASNHHQEQKIANENQKQLSAILKSTTDGIITVDATGLIQSLNSVAANLIGLKKNPIGSSLDSIITIVEKTSQKHIGASELIRRRRRTGALSGLVVMLVGSEGNHIPVEGNVAPLRDASGHPTGAVIAFRSLSEIQHSLLQMEAQSARSEALLRILEIINSHFNIGDILISILKESCLVLDADAAGVLLLEDEQERYRIVATYASNEKLARFKNNNFKIQAETIQWLMSQDKSVVCIPNIQKLKIQNYQAFFSQEDIRTIVMAGLKHENRMLGVLVFINSEHERDYSREELNFIKGLADQASLAIEKGQLFERLLASRSNLQTMAKRLVDVQESERRAVARELHDQVGQVLTGLQFSLESGKRLADGKLRTTLEESQQLVSSLMKQIRELSLRLVPSMLDDMGLLRTLIWHFEQYSSQTGIQVRFTHVGLDKRFPPEIEISAYRIVQEALTNVARYAKVDQVDVDVKSDDKLLNILVRDLGGGFDPQRTVPQNSSFGLTSMKERALLVGGQFKIKSELGAGTELFVTLPLTKSLERRRYER